MHDAKRVQIWRRKVEGCRRPDHQAAGCSVVYEFSLDPAAMRVRREAGPQPNDREPDTQEDEILVAYSHVALGVDFLGAQESLLAAASVRLAVLESEVEELHRKAEQRDMRHSLTWEVNDASNWRWSKLRTAALQRWNSRRGDNGA